VGWVGLCKLCSGEQKQKRMWIFDPPISFALLSGGMHLHNPPPLAAAPLVTWRFFLIIFRLPAFRSPKRSLGDLKAGLASRMQYKKKGWARSGSLSNGKECTEAPPPNFLLRPWVAELSFAKERGSVASSLRSPGILPEPTLRSAYTSSLTKAQRAGYGVRGATARKKRYFFYLYL